MTLKSICVQCPPAFINNPYGIFYKIVRRKAGAGVAHHKFHKASMPRTASYICLKKTTVYFKHIYTVIFLGK